MAKMQIKITKHETGFLRTPETIVEIDINCGNWKYWDDMQETTEKTSLTINNIGKSYYLTTPVKDAIGYHDQEAWEENREIIIKGASVRTYDSLLEYLNCRINNAKESCLKNHTFNAVMFEEDFVKSTDNTVVKDIVYTKPVRITVEITKEDGI